MHNELISIVVPIYNVKDYLEKCVDSIINQTYSNIEIILVDDGSTDGCSEICDKLKNKDKRIVVVHKSNGGLSDARNIGTKKSKGKYITYIDSDDYINKKYIEYLYNLCKQNDCDISIIPLTFVYENKKEKTRIKKEKVCLLNKKEALEELLYGEKYSVSSCGKMFSRKVINNIEFPVGKLCEDVGTTYRFFLNANRVIYSNADMYYYFQRKGSITRERFNEKKLDLIEMSDLMSDDILKKYHSLELATISRKIEARFSILRQIITSKNEKDFINIENQCIQYILESKKIIIHNPKSPKRQKFGLVLLLINKKVFKIGWKVYTIIRKT